MREKEVLAIIEQAAREGQTLLDLSGKGLQRLPAEIGGLDKLESLFLHGNQLSSLPVEIGRLINLRGLWLDGNQLKSLPTEIGRLVKLENLSLDGNQLSSLPVEIGQLANLERLRLADNQMNAWPAEIGMLTSLELLGLNGNQLNALPAEIGRLTNLKELYLSGNQLSMLPTEIGQLIKLEQLTLKGNQLSSLPAEIGQLTSLKKLNLNNNRLSSLPKEIARLINLVSLDIGGNQLPIAGDILVKTDAPAEIIQAYMKTLKDNKPLKVFLCHSSGDKPKVRELYSRLRNDGIEPWLDEEDLIPGQDWQIEIPKAVKNSQAVLVCLSNSAITKEGYVQKEIKYALDVADEKPEGVIFLIPVKLEPCQAPGRLSRWQWVNLYEEGGYERLLKALRLRAESLGLVEPRG